MNTGLTGVTGPSRGDLPCEHHGVVLVRQVVTVRHVRPDEVPESPVQDHRLPWVEKRDDVAHIRPLGIFMTLVR